VGRMRRWCQEAGLREALWKDLRSTFGTHASEQVGLRFAQHALGHTDPNLTERRYAALRGAYLADQAKKLQFGTYSALTGGDLNGEGAGSDLRNSSAKPAPSTARDTGFEPVAFGSGGRRSIWQLFASPCIS
jgi:hypothetical protein